jgi:hypothetical protein
VAPDRRRRDDPAYHGPERRSDRLTAMQVEELRAAVTALTGRVGGLAGQVSVVGELVGRQQRLDEAAAHAEAEAATALARLAEVDAKVLPRDEHARILAAERAEHARIRARHTLMIGALAAVTTIITVVLGALLIVALARQHDDSARLQRQARVFGAACAARNNQLEVQRHLYADEIRIYTTAPTGPQSAQLAAAVRSALNQLPPAQQCTT